MTTPLNHAAERLAIALEDVKRQADRTPRLNGPLYPFKLSDKPRTRAEVCAAIRKRQLERGPL